SFWVFRFPPGILGAPCSRDTVVVALRPILGPGLSDHWVFAARSGAFGRQRDPAADWKLCSFASNNGLACSENRQAIHQSTEAVRQCCLHLRAVWRVREAQRNERATLRQYRFVDLGRTLANDHGSNAKFSTFLDNSLDHGACEIARLFAEVAMRFFHD